MISCKCAWSLKNILAEIHNEKLTRLIYRKFHKLDNDLSVCYKSLKHDRYICRIVIKLMFDEHVQRLYGDIKNKLDYKVSDYQKGGVYTHTKCYMHVLKRKYLRRLKNEM